MAEKKRTSNKRIAPLAAAMLVVIFVPVSVCAQEPEEGIAAETTGPWIDANSIYLAPTTARMVGGGYEPGVTLWLDVTDPLGGVYTTQVVTDAAGRIIADVAVDESGIHQARVRDGAGQVLSEGELFVGLQ